MSQDPRFKSKYVLASLPKEKEAQAKLHLLDGVSNRVLYDAKSFKRFHKGNYFKMSLKIKNFSASLFISWSCKVSGYSEIIHTLVKNKIVNSTG